MKTFILISLFLISITGFSQTPNLIGEWKSENNRFEYQFMADSSATFTDSGYPVHISEYTVAELNELFVIWFQLKRGGQSMLIPALVTPLHADTLFVEQLHQAAELKYSEEGTMSYYNQHTIVRQHKE